MVYFVVATDLIEERFYELKNISKYHKRKLIIQN